MEEEKKVIRGYKGFDKDLKCLGFQYEVGKEYECKKAVACVEGFHFCENPLDVLMFYPPFDRKNLSRFCEVEGSGEFDLSENDKVCCSNIKITEEIDILKLIKEGEKIILEGTWLEEDNFLYSKNYTKVIKGEVRSVSANTGLRSVATNMNYGSVATNTGANSIANNAGCISAAINTGDSSVSVNNGTCSIAANTGDFSAARNSGFMSAVTNTGGYSVSVNTGDCAIATNLGEHSLALSMGKYSAATNVGDVSAAKSSGEHSLAANIGDSSMAINTGKCSTATNIGISSIAESKGNGSTALSTGNESSASVEGEESVAIVTGKDCKAKGALGCWLVLTERGEWNEGYYPIKDVKVVKVDGETIKPNTYYELIDGEVKEATEKD